MVPNEFPRSLEHQFEVLASKPLKQSCVALWPVRNDPVAGNY